MKFTTVIINTFFDVLTNICVGIAVIALFLIWPAMVCWLIYLMGPYWAVGLAGVFGVYYLGDYVLNSGME